MSPRGTRWNPASLSNPHAPAATSTGRAGSLSNSEWPLDPRPRSWRQQHRVNPVQTLYRRAHPPARTIVGMTGTAEYCPISMGTEVVAERWNVLIIREMIVGARRFNDIHRGLPGLSRTLLSQRLRTLQRYGLVEPLGAGEATGGGYRLTEAGLELRPVLEAIGSWAVRWRFPEPQDDQLNPRLLLLRMQSGLAREHLPNRRIVIQFSFENDRPLQGWLIADRDDSTVCARDPLFGVDVYASASTRAWHEIWYGYRSLRESIANGDVILCGEKDLLTQFEKWFHLSHFADEVAAVHRAGTVTKG